jgi:DNA-binding GntR family transcriptional regulator
VARAVQEHERMIELLGARDGARLRKLLIAHVEHKRDAVLRPARGTLSRAARAGRDRAHERALPAS